MKKVLKDTPHIFIRLNDFEGNNYIEEHIKVEKKYGYTWLLKVGKTINKNYLNEIIEKKGGIILKSSVKRGNQFYYCDLMSIDPTNEELVYPDYYNEYFVYGGYENSNIKEIGYWFKIKNIREISDDLVSNFVINKGGKQMMDCAKFTRVVHMYIRNTKDISI